MEAVAKNTLSHFSVSSPFVNIKEWDLCCCCSDISLAVNEKKEGGGGHEEVLFPSAVGVQICDLFPSQARLS